MAAPSRKTCRSSAGLIPDRPVDVLVERGAAGGELAQLVVLGPHQGRAVAEGPADPLGVERPRREHARPKSGWESDPRPIPTKLARPSRTFAAPAWKRERLEPAIARADHGQAGERSLDRAR